MKNCFSVVLSLFTCVLFAQNIQVDNSSYTPQELIEDILINSDCISNVVVTNVVGGNFGGTDQSYGYFDATGTSFPITNGLVLSTGRLSNVPGPNTSLSDDDASGWLGDADLETALGENNTYNATILEFDFQSISNQISFRYLFASEEYQEGDANTCQYSDLFGFLIRPASASNYTNIALVPGTNTPVKVTTVHSGIPGSCQPINESYFGGWNNAVAPINFNGQTSVLTASANIIPNETYHVKLVIADEANYRYDSAVFLEAGSFTSNIELGTDRLFATRNPLCQNETLDLDATQTGATAYTWFKDGLPIAGETNPTYTILDTGTYSVSITYPSSCITTGEITVEYATIPIVNDTTLIECDSNQDGLTTYNLLDAEQDIISSGSNLVIQFYNSPLDAQQETNAITNVTSFENTTAMQTVYARVRNEFDCYAIAEITLDISSNTVTIPPFTVCDNAPVDGFSEFDLNQLRTEIETQVPAGSSITFFPTEADLIAETNSIDGNYTNTISNTETIYVRITNGSSCYAVSTVTLSIIYTPVLLEEETIKYCVDNFPNTISLEAGHTTGAPQNFTYQWLFNNTATTYTSESININQIGTYTVIATHQDGCSATRNIIVEATEMAVIETVTVAGIAPNNSVTITVSGNGDYEFTIDNINNTYQDSNIFTNVSAGEHIVYVRDKNGCETTEETIYVLGFPPYFTPNGDSYNDYWMPLGVDIDFKASMTIQIFDRYGKLLKQLHPDSQGFDGRYNSENLPTSDYWFIVTFSNGKSYRGHFALVR
ncbi:T9SS type B sorting domain-containing protein [Lacinutrix sp. C3R15]|uniref:T9SS type B sorting domain-containing protein n=1 Tax=Flavobacteriaceae TaxID=49546 RepID=UPI001C090A1A|nr:MULTISPECIES: choice-of-anchor L domain-containing protein [Flavobacteriaceae]MBU2940664.1 T9SS type B sorting domain-containing protein [Lacinutrix sp. C3R15]MDO6623982.1 choice-of-anchor L domain-containing protein [Oceanihabitans sp. 1_MG-2023]